MYPFLFGNLNWELISNCIMPVLPLGNVARDVILRNFNWLLSDEETLYKTIDDDDKELFSLIFIV